MPTPMTRPPMVIMLSEKPEIFMIARVPAAKLDRAAHYQGGAPVTEEEQEDQHRKQCTVEKCLGHSRDRVEDKIARIVEDV